MTLINNATPEDLKQIDNLDKLLETDPNNIKILMEKAFVLYSCFMDEEAVLVYKKIIEIDPNFVDAYFWMAECMRDHLADFDEAIAAMHIALKLDPSRADCHEILAWCILSLHNDTPEYFYHIRKSIELEPTWIAPRISLIESLINLGNFVEAQQELNALKAQIKASPVIHFDEDLWNMEVHYECLITRRACENNYKTIEKFQKKIDAGLRK